MSDSNLHGEGAPCARCVGLALEIGPNLIGAAAPRRRPRRMTGRGRVLERGQASADGPTPMELAGRRITDRARQAMAVKAPTVDVLRLLGLPDVVVEWVMS